MSHSKDDLWHVRETSYRTYEEITEFGDVKPRIVATDLTHQKAMELVETLGFGFSAHPQ